MSKISFRPGIRQSALAASLALAVVGLTGCAAEMPSPPANNQYVLEPIRLTHQITFASGGAELSPAEGLRLVEFLDEIDPDGEATIYLDARGPGKDQRLDVVASVLGKLGRKTSGGGASDGIEQGVTLTLAQDVILPQACLSSDQWPDPRLPPASCTQALTLVQMVEDQNDLLRGRALGPALSQTAANAAARHLGRSGAGEAEEKPASVEPTTPKLPPSPLTREASY
jgi:hypothetical protein